MARQLWKLEEFPFHSEKLSHNETLFTLGNGYLATRGTFEEGYEGDMATTMVHGIFDHAPGMLVPELVNVPNWLPIHVTIDGTPFRLINQNDTTLNPSGGAVLGYRRNLLLDKGLLRREVLFRAESGAIVRLVFERFASLADVHVLAQRVQIIAVDGEPEIEVEAFIDHHVTNMGVEHWTDAHQTCDGNMTGVALKTGQSGYGLGMASQLIAPNATTVAGSDNDLTVTASRFRFWSRAASRGSSRRRSSRCGRARTSRRRRWSRSSAAPTAT